MMARFRRFSHLIAIASIGLMAGCRGLVGPVAGSGPAEVSVTLAGSGTGTVTSTPAGINCPTVCRANFSADTQVTLTATPDSTFTFAGWGGSCSGNTDCSVTATESSSVTATFGATLQTINHIVVFLQENRSFDHYFGALRQYWKDNGYPDQQFDGLPQFNPTSGTAPLQGPAPAIPGCDPAQPFPASQFCQPDPNNLVTSYHMQSVCQENPSPFWNESHRDWDLADPAGNSAATMNGFAVTAADDARQQSPNLMDTNGLRAMGYFTGDDLNYYYFMASNFGTSDRWFSPVMDRTQLNRMYLLAATSQGLVHPIAPPETQLTAPIIFEELQNAGISWKIYVDPQNTSCESDPTSDCLYNYSYISQFTYGQTIAATPTLVQNIVPVSQFTADAQNGTLPQVALIEPPSFAGLDEHPSDYDISSPANLQSGANFAAGLINSVMTGPSWKDSVVFFTYDEGGGFYDHVPPQPMPSPDGIKPKDLIPGDICDSTGTVGGGTCDFTYTGFRVPMIVISPFSKKNFVSHQVRDYTAILKFIETRFNLAALTKRDAAQPDMSEFFDFVNEPWAKAPNPPAQNMAGQCTLTPPTS
ncbi:MAG TPA: alkaline phosphatase family protein [Terriglobales bacterium]|nr:alkaline phosphatase family protein [Terriglobales bacterium]